MKEKQLRFGIIGPGNIAHALAQALSETELATLSAVAGRNLERAQAFADQYGCKQAYEGVNGLLDDRNVDIVYIATPHPQHAELIIACARAGKHILCEKPMSLNAGQALAALEACRLAGVFFMEAFMYRCHPQTLRLADLVREGIIGELRHIQADFSFYADQPRDSRLLANELGGGGILDVGCYPASMARLLSGSARGQAFCEPNTLKAVGQLDPVTQADLWTNVSARFEGGLTAELSCAVQLQRSCNLTLFGTQGQLKVNSPWFCNGTIIHQSAESESRDLSPQVDARHLYVYEIEEAVRCIDEGLLESPRMSWDDSLGNLHLLDYWRADIGQQYRVESAEGGCPPVSGEAPRPQDGHKMPYGQLAGLEKPVSRLIMGCDNQKDLAYASVIFDDFFEKGGNTFDTATVYRGFGSRPSYIGQWIQNRGLRDEVVLIDKGAHTPYCHPQLMFGEVERCLDEHKTDYIDLYIMHRDNPDVPVGEFVEVIHRLHQAGHIRAWGVSNWSLERLRAAIDYATKQGLTQPSCLNNNFSLAEMVSPVWTGCISAAETSYRQWLIQEQFPNLAWSSQARGFFTERAGPDKREDAELVRCWYSPENFQRRERAIELAKEKGVLPINIALAYVLEQPFPSFALIGPRTLVETRTTLPGLDIRLSEEEIAWLNLEREALPCPV